MVDMVFLVFIGFSYLPPAWNVFLWGQKSSPKDFLSVVVVYAFLFSAKGGCFEQGIASTFSSRGFRGFLEILEVALF